MDDTETQHSSLPLICSVQKPQELHLQRCTQPSRLEGLSVAGCVFYTLPHCTLHHPITPASTTPSLVALPTPAVGQCRRTAASSYHILIDELAEVLKAMLFCYGVWIVAIFVGYTVGLQCSRACKQQGSEVLQPVSCSKVKQCWQLLIPLICENTSLLESRFLSSSNRASK